MANCPNCNRSVPWYKAITHTRWTGVKCNNCGTKSFIKNRDLYIWSMVPSLILFPILAFVMFTFNMSSLLIALVGLIVFYLFYFTFGWKKTQLEIRDKKEK